MGAAETPAFGLLLRRHRNAAGMTQEELAERAGMSARGIGDLERGLRLPRRDTLRLLIAALALAPEEESRLAAAARARATGPALATPFFQTGSFLGAVPTGRLVARAQEVGRALGALDVVIGGSGRLLLLTGEPGIGKTRVAQEVAVEAVRRGCLVATGRCYEPEQEVPFHPFAEALTVAYAALPRNIREEVPSRWPYLNALLPEDATEVQAPAPGPTGGMEGQQRLLRAVSGLLNAVAEAMPVAILLDDLHWADDASLRLLLHLARHTRSSRVLLLGTYRDVDVDARHPLERALVDLNRERLVERVVLHRLELSATAELIAETLGKEVVGLDEISAMVHEVTNGNPFFVQEVLRMLVAHGTLYDRGGRWYRGKVHQILPPDTVRAAIEQRLTRLPGSTADALREASVLGQTFGFDELLAVGGRSETELEESLEAAAGMGLIREMGEGSYAFNHVLTQQALYLDLSQRRRQRLHLAAGEALARNPEPIRVRRAAELAWHFSAGGDVEQAVTYSVLAGERAEALFAYEEAQHHFRTAVELTSLPTWASSDASLRPRALARLGRVLDISERYDEALAILEEAASIYRAQGDLQNEVMCLAEIGWIHHNRRTDEEGVARILPVMRASRDRPPSPERDRMLAILHTALARLYFGLGRYGDELDAAECAAASARQIGDDVVLAVAESRRGAALMTLGRRGEAREALEHAVALAEATGNLGTMSVALDNLGELAAEGGDYRQCRWELERAVAVAEQTGLPGRMGWTLVRLGRILLHMGEWEQASAALERSAQLLEDDERSAVYPSLHLAQLGAWRGEPGRAPAELEAVTAAADGRDRWVLCYGSRILAELDLLAGRSAAARDRLAPLLEGTHKDDPLVLLLFAPLAWAWLELNEPERTEGTLAEGMERAQMRQHQPATVDLLRVQGMLRARQGRCEEARRSLEEAVALAYQMPDPYREALCRAELAVVADRMGDKTLASEAGDAALAIVRALEAGPCTRYIEGRTTERGAGPRTRR